MALTYLPMFVILMSMILVSLPYIKFNKDCVHRSDAEARGFNCVLKNS